MNALDMCKDFEQKLIYEARINLLPEYRTIIQTVADAVEDEGLLGTYTQAKGHISAWNTPNMLFSFAQERYQCIRLAKVYWDDGYEWEGSFLTKIADIYECHIKSIMEEYNVEFDYIHPEHFRDLIKKMEAT